MLMELAKEVVEDSVELKTSRAESKRETSKSTENAIYSQTFDSCIALIQE
jgi:hypothetical protein